MQNRKANIKKWDAFISHANEDKDSVVRELATILQNFGVNIWYDETTLVVGDSLSKQIDKGLREANFGIVIISKSFLSKRWTDYEYRSLLSKEENFRKIILPVWHEVTPADVKNFSLYLADKFALSTTANSLLTIAFQLTEVIRPDIASNFYRIALYQRLSRDQKNLEIHIGNIHPGPRKRTALPGRLITRIKLIRFGIGRHFPSTLEQDIDCYLRENNPEAEVEVWETLNCSYYEFIKQEKIADSALKEKIAAQLLFFSSFPKKNDFALPNHCFDRLFDTWRKNCHLY